ncbi:large ribosomal subunit protein mL44-like [Convolutriloba macropyga]|uniref:large ribosomal subunit protein mL44-like n=1 Tax=Convolutriloba macropyga TaxID=536237 RepID=UPI003F51FAFA
MIKFSRNLVVWRSCYSYKSPFPTLHYNRKRLQRIEHEQFVEGPPPSWPRCFFPNWNHFSELRAFAFRINEPMNVGFLRNAFVDESFHLIPPEELRIRKLTSLPESDNNLLFLAGRDRVYEITKMFLLEFYPTLPQEAIKAVCENLASETNLSHVGRHLGIEDLIIGAGYPYTDTVIYRAVCALIETIAKQRSSKNAAQFIHDFICTQLITKDLFQIWRPLNPETILNEILKSNNAGPIECRLIYEASTQSVLPVFTVGVFSNKQILAAGSGNSIVEAQKDAYLNSIKFVLNLNWETYKPVSFDLDRIEVES